METEPKKVKQPDEPSVGIRLVWWFGVYFGAQVPLLLYINHFWNFKVIGIIAMIRAFPFGLGHMISTHLTYDLPAKYQGVCSQFCNGYLPYLIYLAHLGVSLAVRSKRVFYLLMLALAVILALNLSSCVSDIPTSWD